MSTELKIVEKDVSKPKLTLTTNRAEIKFPLDYDEVNKQRCAKLARHIVDTEPVRASYRGRFDDDGITLWNDANTQSKRYFYILSE